jgi:hypothetical protein
MNADFSPAFFTHCHCEGGTTAAIPYPVSHVSLNAHRQLFTTSASAPQCIHKEHEVILIGLFQAIKDTKLYADNSVAFFTHCHCEGGTTAAIPYSVSHVSLNANRQLFTTSASAPQCIHKEHEVILIGLFQAIKDTKLYVDNSVLSSRAVIAREARPRQSLILNMKQKIASCLAMTVREEKSKKSALIRAFNLRPSAFPFLKTATDH